MIPKVIHYCWFGRNPLPKLALKCIESWRKFLPDYEIKEWNEDNFDVNIIPYTAEAYAAKKYAFVSDYARMWILYHYGGLYFDTDVEVIKPLDDIIDRGPFMGVEIEAKDINPPAVNPGLGLGAIPGLDLYKAILDYYTPLHFVKADGTYNQVTVVTHTTNVLSRHGLRPFNGVQHIEGINVYPKDYFNPFNDITGTLNKTANTRSIHWYNKSWLNRPKLYHKAIQFYHRLFFAKKFE